MSSKGLFKKKQGNHRKLSVFPSDLITKQTKKSFETAEYSMNSLCPLITSNLREKPSIPLVGIGGAGLNLLSKVIERISAYGYKYQTAGIDLDWDHLDQFKSISNKLKLGETGMGTAVQFRIGTKIAKDESGKLKEFLRSYLEHFEYGHKHRIVFFILGSGGTGVGVGLESMKIVKELGYRPVPIMILPDQEASTRVRFTAAVGLYYFTYAPGDRSEGLMTILIDNQFFFENNKKLAHEELINFINTRVGISLGDLIISTEVMSDGYSTDLNEFLEVFRTVRGIGSILDMISSPDIEELADFLKNNLHDSVAHETDPLNSTRSYVFIQAKGKKVTAIDMRNTLSMYDNSDIFPKYSVKGSADEKFIRVLSIFTGNPLNKRLRELMLEAEDDRVDVLERTKAGEINGAVIQKIEKLKDGDKFETFTADEIRETLALEIAAKRRGEIDE